jgi:hypothetical protein
MSVPSSPVTRHETSSIIGGHHLRQATIRLSEGPTVMRGLFALFLLASCSHASIPLTPRGPLVPMAATPVARNGEQWVWKITMSGIDAGRARLAFATGAGVIKAHLESEATGLIVTFFASTYALVDTLAASDGRPIDSDELSIEGEQKTHLRTTFDERGALVASDQGRMGIRLGTDPPTYNLLGTILIMRGWRAPPGSRAVLQSLSGVVLRRIELVMGRSEVIAGQGVRRLDGRFRTVSVMGRAPAVPRKARDFTIWFSEKGDLPVRIEVHFAFGDLTVLLTAHAG